MSVVSASVSPARSRAIAAVVLTALMTVVLVALPAVPATAAGATPRIDLTGPADGDATLSRVVRWMHNNTSVGNDLSPSEIDADVIASASDENINPTQFNSLLPSETLLFTDNFDDASFDINSPRFFEYSFTTPADLANGEDIVAVSNKDWGMWAQQTWGTGTALLTGGTVPHYQGFDGTVLITEGPTFSISDNTVLVDDEQIVSGDYVDYTAAANSGDPDFFDAADNILGTPSYRLKPSTTYTIRSYPYNTDDGTGRAAWDDFTIYTQNNPVDYADDYRFGDPAVDITSPDVTVNDAESDLVTVTVTFTDPVAGDRLFIDGVEAVIGDSGFVAGVPFTVAAVAGAPTVTFGPASSADMAMALATLTYDTTVNTPGASTRTFAFTATDGTSTSSATSIITVYGDNIPPVAVDDDRTTPFDTTIANIEILENDSDNEGPLDVATVELLDDDGNTAMSPYVTAEGTFTLHADGRVSFAPVAGFIGTAAVDYRVADGDGAWSNTATLTVTVTGPLVVAKTGEGPGGETVNPGETVTYTVSVTNGSSVTQHDVVLTDPLPANTSYVAGSTVASVTRPVVSIAATDNFASNGYAGGTGWTGPWEEINDFDGTGWGNVSMRGLTGQVGIHGDPSDPSLQRALDSTGTSTGTWSFLLRPQQVEAGDTIGFEASADGGAWVSLGTRSGNTFTSAATVTLDVSSMLPASELRLRYRVVAGTNVGAMWDDANIERWIIDDVDVSLSSPPSTNKNNAGAGSQLVSGVPSTIVAVADDIDLAPGETLVVTYQVAIDASIPLGVPSIVNTASAVSTETTTPASASATNDFPVVGPAAEDDSDSTEAETPVTLAVLDNDSGVSLSLLSNTVATSGTVVDNGDGTYTYTPDDGFSGTDSFTYTVEDDGGLTDTATVTITVTPTAGDDIDTTEAETPVTVSVLGNDVGTSLATVSNTNPANGSVVDNGDGTFTYTPADDFSGTDSFDYTVEDAEGQEVTATVTITVTPTAADDADTTEAETPVTVAVLGNDVGSSLAVVSNTDPANGSVVDNGDGTFTYTPADDFSGTDSFDYTVEDAEGQEVTATVTITVTPTAGDDADTTEAETPVTVSVLGNDVGTSLAVVANTDPANGSVVDNGDGTFTYTPADGFSGTDSFTYTVEDADGQETTATVTITVTPTSADDTGTTEAETPVTVSVLSNDLGTGLAVVSTTDPSNGTVVDNGDGTVTYTPAAGFSGTDTFTYTVEDAEGQQSTATVTITVTPTAANDSDTTAAGTPVTVGVLGNDVGTSLAVVSNTNPANGTVLDNGDGTFTYTPADGFSGVDSFTYTVEDADGQQATATVSITVTPGSVDDTDTTVAETAITRAAAAGVLANDAGVGFTVVSFTAINPAEGTLTIDADGGYTFTPAAGFSGEVVSTYTAEDADGEQTTATLTITVTPAANPDADTTPAQTPVTITEAELLNDDIGSGLTVVSVGSATDGTVVLNGDGSATFTPADGFSGTATFEYTIEDSNGSQATALVTITVTPVAVNDTDTTAAETVLTRDAAAGVLADDLGTGLAVLSYVATNPSEGTLAMAADGGYTFTPAAGFSGEVATTYTVEDAEGQITSATLVITVTPVAADDADTTDAETPVTVSVLGNDAGSALAVVSNTNPTTGTVVDNGDGTFTYTPAAGFSGTDSFTYTVEDAEGQQATATVTITVTPTAGNDVDTTEAETPVTVSVLGNDVGTSLAVVANTDPANGSVVDNGDGTFTYTPADGFSGTDSFTYTVEDADGQETTATVTITVTPTSADDAETTTAETPVTVSVLDNDLGTGLTIVSNTDPTNGSVVDNGDGTFTYTPADGFSGTDSFTYTVEDAEGEQSTATVTITVRPTAGDDIDTTEAETPVTVSVLGNDIGTSLAVVSNTDPSNGTVVDNGDGTFTYTPADGFSGTDSFTYTVEDAEGQEVTATVTITVTPTAANDVDTTEAETPVTVDVRSNDVGTSLDVVAATNGANGTTVIDAAGTVTYTPADGFSGTDSFTYTVEDADGQEVTATVTITVTPTAGNDTDGTDVDTPVTRAAGAGVLVNDVGTGLTVVGFTAIDPAEGTLTIDADGGYTFTPADGFSGVVSSTYTVEDDEGQQTTATLTIAVAIGAINDTDATTAETAITRAAADGVLDNDRGTGLEVIGFTPINASEGTLTIAADGGYTFTPAAGFSGEVVSTYTAEDDEGQQVTATLTITVTPTAADDADSTEAETPVTVSVLGNDVGSSLAVLSNTDPSDGIVVDNGDGTFTYTPADGFSGTDSFTYTVEDADGQQATATVTITVTPTAVDDNATTNAETPVVVTVLTDDVGSSLEVVSASNGTNGTTVVNVDGTITYTPADGFSGTDSFTYTVEDADGQQVTATVTITVTPVAVDDSYTTPFETPVAGNIRTNDVATGPVSFTITSAPAFGTVSLNTLTGTFTYTPVFGYTGSDAFVYEITDAEGRTNSATVLLTITPAIADDADTTEAETPVTVDVLGNDSGTALTVVSNTDPSNGTVVDNGDGTFTYTPAAGFSGTDTFTYTAQDGEGQPGTATVTITVTPVGADDTATTASGTPVVIDVVENDLGSSLEVLSTTNGANGTVSINADGTVTYTPAAGFSGTDTFTYTAEDAEGQPFTATVTVTVTPTTAANDSAETPGGTLITRDATTGVLANDAGTSIVVTGHDPVPAEQGELTINPDGSYTFQPTPGFTGTVTVTYTIEDEDGQTATATLTIVVGEDPALLATFVRGECRTDMPYLAWSLDLPAGFPDQGANPMTITFVNPDGEDYVITGQPLDGEILWPGASDTEPRQWPGFERLADGTYRETDGNFAWTRDGVEVLFSVNPEYTATVIYPPDSSRCANVADDLLSDTGTDLAETGSDVVKALPFALGLLLLGFFVMAGARRRRES